MPACVWSLPAVDFHVIDSRLVESSDTPKVSTVPVADGAVLEAQFDGNKGFAYPLPPGFSGVVATRALI